MLVALLLIKTANIFHDMANKPEYLMTNCGKLRVDILGQVQLPQHTELLWQLPLPDRPVPASFKPLDPCSEPFKPTEGVHQKTEPFASLSRVVTAVCAERRRDEHLMGEAGTPLLAHGQRKGPHLLRQPTLQLLCFSPSTPPTNTVTPADRVLHSQA